MDWLPNIQRVQRSKGGIIGPALLHSDLFSKFLKNELIKKQDLNQFFTFMKILCRADQTLQVTGHENGCNTEEHKGLF